MKTELSYPKRVEVVWEVETPKIEIKPKPIEPALIRYVGNPIGWIALTAMMVALGWVVAPLIWSEDRRLERIKAAGLKKPVKSPAVSTFEIDPTDGEPYLAR